MIVVDTNILAYFFLRSEFRNLLAGYLRRGNLTFDQALSLQTAAEQLLNGREYAIDSGSVLRLDSESQCSAYDCEFVVLAQRLGVALVTMDGKVRRALPIKTIGI